MNWPNGVRSTLFCALVVSFGRAFACDCYKIDSDQYWRLCKHLSECIDTFSEAEELHGIRICRGFDDDMIGYYGSRKAANYYMFNHLPSFSAKNILSLFGALAADFNLEMDSWTISLQNDVANYVNGSKHCYWVDENGEKQCIPYSIRRLEKIKNAKWSGQNAIAETQDKFYEILDGVILRCKEQCRKNPRAYYESGVLHFLRGNVIEAIEDGITFLKKVDADADLSSVYLQLGEAYSETLEYDKAIECLTKAIKASPENKQAYFERAVAYFENGQFDQALEDYLVSNIKPKSLSLEAEDFVSFASGISIGAKNGGVQAGVEFIPSLLSSLHGIGETLWTFAQDPIHVSQDFVESAIDCFNFVRSSTSQELLETIVPELKDLIGNWDQLAPDKRGEGTGFIIGKYGVEIFASAGVIKGMQFFRQLKRANSLLNLQAAALSERNRSLIVAEAAKRAKARQEVFRSANLKIQWGKQGKHVEGHNSYTSLKNRSILTHPDPQKLVDNFAGKGAKIGNTRPGVAGYKENVDFGEFIGYSVDRETGEKIATTCGTIHYAKDGVHIVPARPRG